MSNRTDSNIYTIVFAIIMVLIVGSMLAFFASSLKPNIDENKRIEKQQNILYAMSVNANDDSSANFISTDKADKEFTKHIKEQLVLFTDGDKILTQQNRATYMSENNGQEPYLINIKKQKANAKAGKVRKLPLFIGEKDGKTYYIAPLYGKGLWDAIWCYISMDENMIVQGAYFDHKGETPGLGANIKQRFFMDDFIGEHLLTKSGEFRGITIKKGNNDPNNKDKTDYEVDALAGATITGDGVSAMIKSDLSLYVPYFRALKK